MAVAMAQATGGTDPLLRVVAEAEKNHARQQRAGQAPVTGWPAGAALPPLPAGRVVQQGVRCDFVDLRRTFASLAREELTGYVRLVADGVHAAALLAAGGVVAAVHEDQGQVVSGTEAFARMRRTADSGQGVVDVVQLPSVVVGAVRQLLVGPALYSGLSGRFLRGSEFVDFMSEQAITGGIRVRAAGGHAVVLLHEGIIGAYSARSPRPVDSLDAVMELFADPGCEVAANGGPLGPTLPLMIL